MGSDGGGGSAPYVPPPATPIPGVPVAGTGAAGSNTGAYDYGLFQSFLPNPSSEGEQMAMAEGLTPGMFNYRSPSSIIQGSGAQGGTAVTGPQGGNPVPTAPPAYPQSKPTSNWWENLPGWRNYQSWASGGGDPWAGISGLGSEGTTYGSGFYGFRDPGDGGGGGGDGGQPYTPPANPTYQGIPPQMRDTLAQIWNTRVKPHLGGGGSSMEV